MISIDAKDLKVSLRISHCGRTTAEKQRQKKREGRGGRDGEGRRMGLNSGAEFSLHQQRAALTGPYIIMQMFSRMDRERQEDAEVVVKVLTHAPTISRRNFKHLNTHHDY